MSNLKTAKALGMTIPPSLLLRADQVLESAIAPKSLLSNSTSGSMSHEMAAPTFSCA